MISVRFYYVTLLRVPGSLSVFGNLAPFVCRRCGRWVGVCVCVRVHICMYINEWVYNMYVRMSVFFVFFVFFVCIFVCVLTTWRQRVKWIVCVWYTSYTYISLFLFYLFSFHVKVNDYIYAKLYTLTTISRYTYIDLSKITFVYKYTFRNSYICKNVRVYVCVHV